MSLGNQTVPINMHNNHRPGLPLTIDPQLQKIIDRMKVANTDDERAMVYRDLKKIPHLFSAFLKLPESQYVSLRLT